jgi:hypothetical protein
MAVLTQSGRAAIASSIKQQQIHLAWGTGDPGWESTPLPESITARALLHEVGRRTANEVLFCVGDDQGDLLTPTGRFKASDVPTNNLFLRFTFDFENAAHQVIRELGLMVGTQLKPDLPPGQRYFEPQDLTDPGILLVLEHTVPLIRTAATRETFSFVVTF